MTFRIVLRGDASFGKPMKKEKLPGSGHGKL